jgi:hypothetical protein
MNSVPFEHTCIKTGGSMMIGSVQFTMTEDIMRCVLETKAVTTKASDFLIHMVRTDRWQLINTLIRWPLVHQQHSKCATHFSFNVASEITLRFWKSKDVFSLLRITVICRVKAHLSKVTPIKKIKGNVMLNMTVTYSRPRCYLEVFRHFRHTFVLLLGSNV